jgi:enoyl-CoA hydratase/carnithine racemase
MPDFAHRITLEQQDHVATLQFDSDHPANVFTLEMLEELGEGVSAMAKDPPCRVLVIKGRDTIFSGGADLGSIQAMDPEIYRRYVATEYDVFRRIELLPFVTIAVLSGAAVGNAAELALACDLRIASEKTRIGWPELNVAFDAPAQRLARFVGMGKAKEILFSARLLKADEAQALGLLTTVVAPDELDGAVAEAAALYASRPPIGIRLTKENLERAYPFDAGDTKLEIDAASTAFATEDFQEGAAAVLGRRAPAFVGR